MSAHRPDVSLKVTGSLGEANLTESIYAPTPDLMSDFKVRTLAQMEQLVKDKAINFSQVNEAVLVLCGNGKQERPIQVNKEFNSFPASTGQNN